LVLLASIAAIARLALIVSYRPVETNDSATYLDLAHRLASLNLHGSPGARTPGYPAVLLVLGYSPVATWCLQAALGVVATLLLYRLIRTLGGVPGLALVAALLYALDTEVLAVEHLVLTETIASFLILVAASIAVRMVVGLGRTRRLPWLLGATLACLCIVRPDALALTAYLAIASGLALRKRAPGERRSLRPSARALVAIVLPAVVVLASWTAVNRATIGVATVSTVLGHNMIDHVAPQVSVTPGSDHAITAAYVAARTRREAHGGDLTNLSADAEAAIQRATHLDPAHVSQRLLGIAVSVIAHHPIQYVTSSLKQWPRFFLAPNYPYGFRGGAASTAIHAIWKVQRAIRLLVSAAFVALCLAALAAAFRRRTGVLRIPEALLAGAVWVGLLVATFLAYGETGRYGYIYYPLVLTVTCVAAQPLVAAVLARRPLQRERTHASRA
jgi:hypothetical protein